MIVQILASKNIVLFIGELVVSNFISSEMFLVTRASIANTIEDSFLESCDGIIDVLALAVCFTIIISYIVIISIIWE